LDQTHPVKEPNLGSAIKCPSGQNNGHHADQRYAGHPLKHHAQLQGRPVQQGIATQQPSKKNVDKSTSQHGLGRLQQARQGVVGLYQPGLPGEQGMGLSVKFMGIGRKAIASYLISLYCSLAVLTDDAVAVLENVAVEQYHEYQHAYL
jgi:hypothetical protein